MRPATPSHSAAAPGRAALASLYGAGAAAVLLALYFGTLTLVSGWEFTADEFRRTWHFILPLAAGFGVQVALFSRLRALVRSDAGAKSVVAASGTTSTAAMVSCCAHYLVNIAPVLGATGLVAFAAQFQTQFFWAGLAFSAAGILFVAHRLREARKAHAGC